MCLLMKAMKMQNILSNEEKSIIESVLDIVINLHKADDYEQVLLSIQETIDDKLDKHLVGGDNKWQ